MTTDLALAGLDAEKVERYLKSLLGKDIALLNLTQLGEPPDEALGKSYGYGVPIRVEYRAGNGEHRHAVLHTMNPGGNLLSLGKVEEFCLLTEFAEGENYAVDLERLRDTGTLTDLDLARADELCDYLIAIHGVHGDFHPWNILFASGVDFRLLDRSRGEYGDPADDVTSITLNYVFFSLQRSGDREMLQVVAPFFVFRALVMASPVWYPALAESARRKLLTLISRVLESPAFDPTQVNEYCGA